MDVNAKIKKLREDKLDLWAKIEQLQFDLDKFRVSRDNWVTKAGGLEAENKAMQKIIVGWMNWASTYVPDSMQPKPMIEKSKQALQEQ